MERKGENRGKEKGGGKRRREGWKREEEKMVIGSRQMGRRE